MIIIVKNVTVQSWHAIKKKSIKKIHYRHFFLKNHE